MGDERQAYLTRAVSVLALLSNPNIERVLATCDRDGKFFAATGRANGGQLGSYLKTNGNANLAGMALQLADAVLYLHTPIPGKQFVVVHGNLHPTNVLIHDGKPILSNFALCSISPVPGGVHLSQPVLEDGHMTYKAPELLNGGVRTTQSDVYAFAMLLYAIFAGQEPFDDITPLGAAQQVLSGARPPQARLPPGALGAAIWNIVSSCWVATPAARSSMQQVRAALLPLV